MLLYEEPESTAFLDILVCSSTSLCVFYLVIEPSEGIRNGKYENPGRGSFTAKRCEMAYHCIDRKSWTSSLSPVKMTSLQFFHHGKLYLLILRSQPLLSDHQITSPWRYNTVSTEWGNTWDKCVYYMIDSPYISSSRSMFYLPVVGSSRFPSNLVSIVP